MKPERGISICGIAVAALAMSFAGPVRAADTITYDANVANGVYFGSGNVNGGWTISTDTDTAAGSALNGDEFEIGLRAKAYQGAVITPETGTGNYDTSTGLAAGPKVRAYWNWEFSIDNLTGGGIAGLVANVTITNGNSSSTNTFNLLDPGLGNNVGDKGNGQQNSENMLFAGINLPDYNPWYGDTYTYTVTLTDGGTTIASDTINVDAVPEPASMALFGLGLSGLAAVRRRRRR